MKKIVLATPPVDGKRKIIRNIDCAIESKGNYLLQPYDTMLLTACFPPQCQYALVDATVDLLDRGEAIRRIVAASPDIIILAMAEVCWDADFAYLKDLRAKFPETLILVYGDAFVEDCCVDHVKDIADGIIVSPLLLDAAGLLEHTRQSLKQVDKFPGLRHPEFYVERISKTPVERTIGVPHHELFQGKAYRWPFSAHFKYTTVMTAWGCPYRCSYCIDSRFPYLYRPWQSIIPELDKIKEMGIKELYFSDKSFGLPKENIKSLLTEMINRKYNFWWTSYFHPLQYEPEILELMRRSGCHTIVIGVETANMEALKKFDRHVTPQRVRDLVDHAHKLGISVCGDFIFGLEGETREDVLKSIDFAIELKLDYASFNIAAPLPGSSVRKSAIADGRMQADEHNFDTLGRGNMIGSDQLSPEELVRLRSLAVRKFYLRPSYMIRRLLGIRTLDQLVIQMQEMVGVLQKLL